ncbi:hypothetical protein EPUL_000573 [Erysiphe pulchra]|uniref:J domain-containing protein n=1 Tax=Erysiphe pulchra TaxID=225359 RepID=A0A2S4PWF4_9PEZI|nr:hypothetical protein EPUL_000573 [Erysiphe pulchra]
MTSQEPLDYYAALGVTSTATQQQIRDAYKRAALKTHPDRIPPDSPERAERTRKFQIVNDAYYTLSDKGRRTDYDSTRKYYGFDADASTASTDDVPKTSGNFPWSSFGFGSKAKTEEEKEKFQSEQFGDVFEEMLRDEGLAGDENKPTGQFWSIVGGLSGAAMGFIVANFPGLVAGAAAGNRLGAVRDKKGKSVYEGKLSRKIKKLYNVLSCLFKVFQELPASDKAKLLGVIASKVLSHSMGL